MSLPPVVTVIALLVFAYGMWTGKDQGKWWAFAYGACLGVLMSRKAYDGYHAALNQGLEFMRLIGGMDTLTALEEAFRDY